MVKALSDRELSDTRLRGGFNIRVVSSAEQDEIVRNVHELGLELTAVIQKWFGEPHVGATVKKFSDNMFEIDIRYPTLYPVDMTMEEYQDAINTDSE